ncbi:PTS sugar transporter subunit IIA [Lentibacillus kapialis]|uniref:PTS sugar transporter subunit IIA n=1 Tax=Lentibacillus kapialis TaxID=340214 RepID=UPI003570DE94
MEHVLTEEMIQIKRQVNGWEEAIQSAARPLVEHAYVTDDYVNAMIENVNELGPYIVIAPEIAIAHARPDDHVKKIGLSLLKLDQSINFAENSHYASLVFVLAAVDEEQHLDMLSELANVLNDSGKVKQLKESAATSEILNIIHKQ